MFSVRLNNGTRSIDDDAEVEKYIGQRWRSGGTLGADRREKSQKGTSRGSQIGHNGRMSRQANDVSGGKALFEGRTLAEWVPQVVDRLFARSAAERIILFGSLARGEDGQDSDIDVVVVTPLTGRKHDEGVRLMAELADLPVPVDVVVVDSANFPTESRLPGIVRVAVREGRIFERAA